MQNSIVLELQSVALNEEYDITNILRKALLVATKLNLEEFKHWISYELNGYIDCEDNIVPDYRKITVEIKVKDQYHGLIDVEFPDKNIADILCNYILRAPIKNLDVTLKNHEDYIELPFTNHEKSVFKEFKFRIASEPITRIINPNTITTIIDIVRNNILEWSLKLESEGIIGDGVSFSIDEKKNATNNSNINIKNFHGNMGDIGNLGILSTGDNSSNIYSVNSKIDQLIEELNKVNLKDKEQYIDQLNEFRKNPNKLKKTLGQILTKSSEISSIGSLITSILSLLTGAG